MKKLTVSIEAFTDMLSGLIQSGVTFEATRPEFEINKINSTRFISNIDGVPHYDIPFAYSPYWNKNEK